MSSLTEQARRLKLRLVAIIETARIDDPLRLARSLPAGSWVILRNYASSDRSVLAKRLREICRKKRMTLLIAGDRALAEKCGAGLHLPEYQGFRQLLRRRRPLTVAAHGRMALVRAARLGADAALLSPVFPTASHPGARPLGLIALRRLARQAKLPVIALGGVTAQRMKALKTAKLAGIAAIGGLTAR